jgi:hypothetical protein
MKKEPGQPRDREERAGPTRASDQPGDLLKEREAFVRGFLRRGVELTEELLRENEELRGEIMELRERTTRLTAQVAKDEAVRDLLRTIDRLEAEKRELIARSTHLEQDGVQREGRQDDVERELNDLANVYVASAQLHTGLSVRRVIRNILDIVGQLVGAKRYIVYVVDPDRGEAVAVGFEGLAPGEAPSFPLGEGMIGEACITGIQQIRRGRPLGDGSFDRPLAVVPLVADGRPVGAIVILTLLPQKSGWEAVDEELFALLGSQAAPALIAANLYSRADGPLAALRGLPEKL